MTRRAELEALEREIKITLANIRRKRTALGERPSSPFERDYAKELEDVAAELEGEGVPHLRGIVAVEELGWIVAKQSHRLIEAGHGAQIAVTGLARIHRELDALAAAEARDRERRERWPTPETTYPYRYTGPRFKTHRGDRLLEHGDVVKLNESQAAAFADRFEAVAEEVTT